MDKPWGWSSFDVVKKVRNTLKVRKLGHAGTLDPLATGLLILCADAATKQVSALQTLTKEYHGLLRLGEHRPSYDLETPVEKTAAISRLNAHHVAQVGDEFVGEITQRPPLYSAIKQKGLRAYARVRHSSKANMPQVLDARTVFIESLRVLQIQLPWVFFSVRCGKGTYIRSLAYDWGARLGVGACLYALRRVSIGDYHLNNATTIAAFLRR